MNRHVITETEMDQRRRIIMDDSMPDLPPPTIGAGAHLPPLSTVGMKWFEANPLPGRESVERGSIQWFLDEVHFE